MAKVKEITIGVHYTHALPNYENLKLNVSETIVIEDSDDVEKVKKETFAKLKQDIKDQIPSK